VILEDGSDVAAPLELSQRHRPRIRVWSPGRDVRRNGAPGEVVNADRLAGPVNGVHTTSGTVKPVSICISAIRLDPAPRVVALPGRVDGAVGRFHRSAKPTSALDAAPRIRVQSHGVEIVGVDSLDRVDFTAGRVSFSRDELFKTHFTGQLSRLAVQKAGHEPQTLPGICARSRIIKPLLYVFLDSRRILGRPPDLMTFVESTPKVTD
jgi:hypothetical protein